jgi:hypothetical protein
MNFHSFRKSLFAFAGLSVAASPLALSAADAQYASPPGQGYQQQPGYDESQNDDQGPPPGYDQGGPPPGYDQNAPPSGYDQGGPPPAGYNQAPPPGGYNAPPPGYSQGQGYGGAAPPPPPPGYNGSQPPPPPPGYQAGPDEAQQRDQDQRYAAYAQQWAQTYCVKSRGDAGTGAIIGGVLGAIVGSGLGGRHDHGTGALAGAAVGAAGGAVVADSAGSNATSPGCPPGFVVRRDAPAFSYGGYAGVPYAYAAPGWYRPWAFYGGVWSYRPYPYHVWYSRHYGYPHRYYRGGYRRRW